MMRFIYAVRPVGGIAQLNGRTASWLADSEALYRMLGQRDTQPYGVALDPESRTLWVAHKAAHFLARYQLNTENTSIELLNKIKTPAWAAPCIIDFNKKNGLLVGCYGDDMGRNGGVFALRDSEFLPLPMPAGRERVSHCCWTSDGGYIYVTRKTSVIWWAPTLDALPKPISSESSFATIPKFMGSASDLRLKYVQGLLFNYAMNQLLVADAAWGAIFVVDLNGLTYRLQAGKPTERDGSALTNLQTGSANVCLGRVRAIAFDSDQSLLFIHGESGQFYQISDGHLQIKCCMRPNDQYIPVGGSGLIQSV